MTTNESTEPSVPREETTLDEVYRRLLEGTFYEDYDWASGPALRAVHLATQPATSREAVLGPLWRKVQGVHTEAMRRDWAVDDYRRSMLAALTPAPADVSPVNTAQPVEGKRKFQIGDRVTKTKGSSWTGLVVGSYSTSLTPEGYAVESENEPGSVQIYPASALASKGGVS